MLVCCIPSTTYKESALLVEFTPRILTVGDDPAWPEFTMVKPATFPCNDATGFVEGIFATASPLTTAMEPVKSLFLCVP